MLIESPDVFSYLKFLILNMCSSFFFMMPPLFPNKINLARLPCQLHLTHYGLGYNKNSNSFYWKFPFESIWFLYEWGIHIVLAYCRIYEMEF